MHRRPLTTTLVLSLFVAAIAGAQTSGPSHLDFKLLRSSQAEWGCFPPCLCPIMIQEPLVGSLRMESTGKDAEFTHYDVTDVDWQIPGSGHDVQLRGTGRYRVGGEHAAMQELTLDLQVDGGPKQTFTSGLVAGGGRFPDELDVRISLHGEFCLDSVYQVRAVARTAGVIDGTGDDDVRIRPNPSSRGVEIQYRMVEPGPVDLRVYDLSGREVAVLVREWSPSGFRVARWDGRHSNGGRAGPGLYFARIRRAGSETMRTLVLLK